MTSAAPARTVVRFMPFAALLGAACVLAALLTAGPPPVRGQAGPIPSPSFPPFTVTPPVAPTPIPLDQTAAVSSGSGVQPGGSVTFVDAPPNAAHPLVGAVRLRVENHGDQQASAFYDGLTLDEVARVDIATRTVVKLFTGLAHGPAGVSFGAGAAWVANRRDGALTRIDAGLEPLFPRR